jgi:hypothetical protein
MSDGFFKPDANATPIDQIKTAAPDPRNARVSKVHAQIAAGVRDGSIYEQKPAPGTYAARAHAVHQELVRKARARSK